MFANSLNEFLLVLIQAFGVGIKGCEHECISGCIGGWVAWP